MRALALSAEHRRRRRRVRHVAARSVNATACNACDVECYPLWDDGRLFTACANSLPAQDDPERKLRMLCKSRFDSGRTISQSVKLFGGVLHKHSRTLDNPPR